MVSKHWILKLGDNRSTVTFQLRPPFASDRDATATALGPISPNLIKGKHATDDDHDGIIFLFHPPMKIAEQSCPRSLVESSLNHYFGHF